LPNLATFCATAVRSIFGYQRSTAASDAVDQYAELGDGKPSLGLGLGIIIGPTPVLFIIMGPAGFGLGFGVSRKLLGGALLSSASLGGCLSKRALLRPRVEPHSEVKRCASRSVAREVALRRWGKRQRCDADGASGRRPAPGDQQRGPGMTFVTEGKPTAKTAACRRGVAAWIRVHVFFPSFFI
jgi:hypothetical protein